MICSRRKLYKVGKLLPSSLSDFKRVQAKLDKIDRFRFSCAKSGALDLDETSNFRVATKREAKSDRFLV